MKTEKRNWNRKELAVVTLAGMAGGAIFAWAMFQPGLTILANVTDTSSGSALWRERLPSLQPLTILSTAMFGGLFMRTVWVRDLGPFPILIWITTVISTVAASQTGIGLLILLPLPLYIIMFFLSPVKGTVFDAKPRTEE